MHGLYSTVVILCTTMAIALDVFSGSILTVTLLPSGVALFSRFRDRSPNEHR
jgi:hypothetical protein